MRCGQRSGGASAAYLDGAAGHRRQQEALAAKDKALAALAENATALEEALAKNVTAQDGLR